MSNIAVRFQSSFGRVGPDPIRDPAFGIVLKAGFEGRDGDSGSGVWPLKRSRRSGYSNWGRDALARRPSVQTC